MDYKKLRIEELVSCIVINDTLYWNTNEPEISDVKYDALVKELRDLDPEHPLVNKVHGPNLGTGLKFKHEDPMSSLQKAYSKEEIIKWAESVARSEEEEFFAKPKFDGCACEESTAKDYIATRGDGDEGELVTDKRPIIDFSRKTKDPERGELVVFKSDLGSIMRSDGTPYKTLRSASAGLLGAKETVLSIGKVLRFMPHDQVIGDLTLAELRGLDLEATMADEVALEDYPVDGLVISLVDKEYGESLGMTSHHPRHSIAFKVANPSTESKLIAVEWQVAKHRISPVGILEPTELDGITIERATLHNLKHIRKLKLRIGAKVKLVRAGSVIPAITEALSKGREDIVPPTHCPACGHPTECDGQDVTCPNHLCGGVLAKRLTDSLSRLGIDTVGPAIASSLVKLPVINVQQAFEMSPEDWERVDGFAKPSAMKMWRRFRQARMTPIDDYKILAAMNIQGIGVGTSKRICNFLTISELNQIDFFELEKLEGIGPGRAQAISLDFDRELYFWAMTNFMITTTKGLAERPLICFTGKGNRTRAEWKKLAESRGYTFHSGITKKVSVLLCENNKSTSSKMVKAAKYGIKIMTYQEFENVR